jgi:2-succinyl-6-hydroxy-2,4-cyclohexadiene-1-carboxylate synthase
VSRQALHREIVGSGPRLTLVHGFTQTGRSWQVIADALARDHEVVLVDAPGHGGSDAVDAGLVEGAAWLGEAGGAAVYVGYSMGARLALHLALARPDLVRGLVLLGAHPGIEDPAERAARRQADEALAAEVETIGVDAFLERWLAGPLFVGLRPDAADIEDRRRNTAAGLAASLRRAGTGAQEPLWDRLPELGMPVLVLAGADDEKFTEIGRRTAAGIGPNATFATVPGAGHAAHLEQPAAVSALVRGWLDAPA